MAFPQGIDFRATAGYVTDPTGCDGEIGTTANYPRTTAQGNTVGWKTAPDLTRDRNNALDARLAGLVGNNTAKDYQIDLPAAGSYVINIAAGDASFTNPTKVELFDNTTSLGVLCSSAGVAGASYLDATNVLRSAAAWPGSNVSVTATFASTICIFRLGGNSAPDVLAHVNVASAGGGFVNRPLTKPIFTLPGGFLVPAGTALYLAASLRENAKILRRKFFNPLRWRELGERK